MQFKVGDTVRFLNEEGEGIVKELISAFKVRIEISKGIEIEVLIKELVPVSTALKNVKVLHKDVPLQKPSIAKSKAHAKDELIVDLHIEKLLEDHYGLSNSEKLDIQTAHFRRKLEMAINSHFTKIVFVHGVGAGTLRQTIRDLLRTYEGIEYSDASYQKFGAGATEVRIVSRNKSRGSI